METMCRARIVVDHWESAFAETGDLIIPLRQGLIAGADMHGELGEILLGKAVGRTSVSMGALKPASDFFPCIAILHHSCVLLVGLREMIRVSRYLPLWPAYSA